MPWPLSTAARRAARGDPRVRRGAGDPGPGLSRRGAHPVRRPTRHPGPARDPRPRRYADDRPVHLPRPAGHMYPPQPKRLAPDFFFQKQVYRHDGDVVPCAAGRADDDLEPGTRIRSSNSGSPSRTGRRRSRCGSSAGSTRGSTASTAATTTSMPPAAHYTSPTEGVRAEDMFLQVKGEGLHVGCVLTWGPCYRLPAAVLRARRPTR